MQAPALPLWGVILMWVAIIITCLLFGLWIYRIWKGGEAGKIKSDKVSQEEDFAAISREIKHTDAQEGEVTEDMLSKGKYKCLCFREINGLAVADFTTIPKPIGEMYNFDPSCPLSGSGYIVRVKDGRVIDYDPRKVEYKVYESPEWADLAIHIGDISRLFWAIKIPWWKSAAHLFAAAMIAVVFIVGLVVLG